PVCGGRSWVAIWFGGREVDERRYVAEEDQRITIGDIHRGQIASLVGKRLARASRNTRDVRALPGPRVEYQPAAARARCAAEPQQSVGQLIARCRRAGVDEAPLVSPLRTGLAGRGRRYTLGGPPGVLAKEQQVSPHGGTRLGVSVLNAQ